MKDKLIKFHHKAPYYVMRKIFIITSIFLMTSALIGIPLGIKIYTRMHSVSEIGLRN